MDAVVYGQVQNVLNKVDKSVFIDKYLKPVSGSLGANRGSGVNFYSVGNYLIVVTWAAGNSIYVEAYDKDMNSLLPSGTYLGMVGVGHTTNWYGFETCIDLGNNKALFIGSDSTANYESFVILDLPTLTWGTEYVSNVLISSNAMIYFAYANGLVYLGYQGASPYNITGRVLNLNLSTMVFSNPVTISNGTNLKSAIYGMVYKAPYYYIYYKDSIYEVSDIVAWLNNNTAYTRKFTAPTPFATSDAYAYNKLSYAQNKILTLEGSKIICSLYNNFSIALDITSGLFQKEYTGYKQQFFGGNNMSVENISYKSRNYRLMLTTFTSVDTGWKMNAYLFIYCLKSDGTLAAFKYTLRNLGLDWSSNLSNVDLCVLSDESTNTINCCFIDKYGTGTNYSCFIETIDLTSILEEVIVSCGY